MNRGLGSFLTAVALSLACGPTETRCTDTPCAHGLTCDPGSNTCVAPESGGIPCVPNSRRCSESNLVECNAAGDDWTVAQVCDGGCLSGECLTPDAG